jgi:Fic family protein
MTVFDRRKPYNNLPLLPPKTEIETKRVLQKTISASRALALFNGSLSNLPNPRLFIDTIQLQEAKASSEIENIITTNDDLYQSMVSEMQARYSSAKEVVNYKEALWLGIGRMKEKPFITTNLCIEIVQRIKRNSAGIRVTPGTALANSRGEIVYTPPTGEEVIREKLANLERFINQDQSFDPLIKMAIMHYQFEAIHPFADGNGRTGRILLLLYLKQEKLLDIPAIFLSGYIIHNKADYYERICKVTEENDWESFILFMLEMIEDSAIKGLERLKSIVAIMVSMAEEIKKALPKVYSKELVDLIFKLPYTKRQFLIDAGLGNPKTVGNYLMDLEKAGFLRSVKVGKEKLYLNHRLMQQLEDESL